MALRSKRKLKCNDILEIKGNEKTSGAVFIEENVWLYMLVFLNKKNKCAGF